MRVSSSILILAVALTLVIIPVYAQETNESSFIPSWIKSVAGAWSNDGITDTEYQEAMIFLIEQDIIQINSTFSVSQITDGEKRLFELEVKQKDDRIKILENDVKDIGIDNSKLLQGLTDEQEKTSLLQISLTQSKEDLEQYKKDYPLKIGNIGGKLVVDYIKELEDKIEKLEN